MRAVLLVTVLLLCGCPPPAPRERIPEPGAGKQAWLAALESGEPERVWEMLSPDVRAQWPDRPAFDRWLERYRLELLAHAKALRGPPRETRHYPGGVVLIREAGRWRVLSGPGLGSAPTAAGAARRLRDGLAETLDGELLSRGAAARLRRFLAALDKALRAPGAVRVDGTRATVTLPRGMRLELVREDGWRVEAWGY